MLDLGPKVRIPCLPSPPYRKNVQNPYGIKLRTRHLNPDPHSVPQGTRSLFMFLWRIRRKLLNDRIRVQYSDPDLPGLVRSHRAIVFCYTHDGHRWSGQFSKTTTGPKSGFEVMKSFEKFKQDVSLLRFTFMDPRFGSWPKYTSRAK